MMAASAASSSIYRGLKTTVRVNLNWLLGSLSIVVALLLWEVLTRWTGSEQLLPPPSAVYEAFLELMHTGEMSRHVYWSVRRALIGFGLGGGVAIAMGLLTGRLKWFRLGVEPMLQLLRPIPVLAWVPLSIFWFGVGESPKLFLIALGVFFPVWLNTHIGVRGTPAVYIDAARSLGVRSHELFYRVVLPAALPFIVSGLRIGFALAFILLVAAELTGASAGLGALISHAHLVFRPDRMLVGMAMLGVLGAIVDGAFVFVSKRLVYWE